MKQVEDTTQKFAENLKEQMERWDRVLATGLVDLTEHDQGAAMMRDAFAVYGVDLTNPAVANAIIATTAIMTVRADRHVKEHEESGTAACGMSDNEAFGWEMADSAIWMSAAVVEAWK